MLTGGSVAGTPYVGRHVAVLRTTKKAGSGWVIDGAPTMLFYIFSIFSSCCIQMRKLERLIPWRLLCVKTNTLQVYFLNFV